MEPEIGSIKLAINAHAATDNLQIPLAQSITTAKQAAQFMNGWAYTNGAYISKTYFPKAYDLLVSAGMQHDANNVRLPTLYGFLYAASTKASNSVSVFYQDPQNYGSPSHFHDFNFGSSSDTKTLIRNAAWIWSTKTYGPGFQNTSPIRYGNYVIPAHTSSAHGGHHSTKIKRLLIWDIPINVSSTVTSRIDLTTGYILPGPPSDGAEICPRHIVVNSMIYIGRPQNLP